LILGTVKKMVE